ncbi:NmrA family NAD(P)-binding protein [Amycolatopsis sp. NPDC049252]|uniref:NmrA family NAD(P)-binding protein n=1 Tax=Amycolatopsis sp. NPDC049252 TaxID=3363933 RepID=UPI00371937DC
MILVTTAGKVGAETARLLAGQGEPVRILVRDPVKAEPLAQAGAEVVVGDLGVPATVEAAMKGVSAVVLVSPAIPAEELNVIAGAVRAGVGHVVKITSKSSADSPIARRRDQAEIENGLVASGLGYTLLKNNAYMQNFLMSAPAIAGTSSFGSAAGDGRIGMIDTRDVAAVAAAIAASPSEHAGKTYWPTGPESLSYPDAAAVFWTVLGRPVTFHPLTFSEQKQAMVEAGVPEHIAEMNTQAITLFAEGDSDWVTGDVPAVLGRPARTFAQFVRDNASAFSGGRHAREESR